MHTDPSSSPPSLSVTKLVALIRRTERYEEWKRAVFIRDRFTCQQCGRRNGRVRVIEAHHLTELSRLVKDNQLDSVERALCCPALWVVDNGQTLCRACHQQTESYPKQFVDKPKRGKKKKKKQHESIATAF